MSVVKFKDLGKIRIKHNKQKIVFCHGTFDLTHVGHVLFLESCKKLGDILVVAVADDKVTKSGKGNKRPILNESIRLKMVDSLKPVDYCFLDIAKTTKDSLQVLARIFELLKPNIYAVNEDSKDIPIRQKITRQKGTKMFVLRRWSEKKFGKISTTSIVEKIRNLS